MQLTKIGHSCVCVTAGDTVALVDPGSFTKTEAVDALEKIDALFITHNHPDHITEDHVKSILAKHPEVAVYANAETALLLEEWGVIANLLQDKAVVTHGNLSVSVAEVEHHPIYDSVTVLRNSTLLFNDMFLHPGDALYVPTKPVKAVAVPFAPFANLQELIDYCRVLPCEQLLSVHDGYLATPGPYEGIPKMILKKHDIDFAWWHDGEVVDL